MTRNENECRKCLTDSFVGENEDHRRICNKSHNEAWSLEHTTNTFAQAVSPRPKRCCATHNQSLPELRQNATQKEEQGNVNARYLKHVKHWESEDSQVNAFMMTSNDHWPIA
jgi:arginyl-tRNA--protein-N-Asp/Glu arginylyltransferase